MREAKILSKRTVCRLNIERALCHLSATTGESLFFKLPQMRIDLLSAPINVCSKIVRSEKRWIQKAITRCTTFCDISDISLRSNWTFEFDGKQIHFLNVVIKGNQWHKAELCATRHQRNRVQALFDRISYRFKLIYSRVAKLQTRE